LKAKKRLFTLKLANGIPSLGLGSISISTCCSGCVLIFKIQLNRKKEKLFLTFAYCPLRLCATWFAEFCYMPLVFIVPNCLF